MKKSYTGVFAPLTTPFDNEEVSYSGLRENIQKYNSTDLSGYVVLGSTGEAVYLTDMESLKIVETARKESSPEKAVIAGTARESTRLTMDFTNAAAEAGAEAALIRTPSYFKSRLSQETLKNHYLRIADNSRIPVIIYNIPVHTGINLTKDLILELADHPNIAGLKDSSGNLTALNELLPHLPQNFCVLLGAGGIFFSGILMGAKGGILTLSDVAPILCLRLFSLARTGNIKEGRKLQQNLVPLNTAIISAYGVAGAKYALDLIGYHGGLCRSPLPILELHEKEHIKSILQDLKLL
jgi:4-hydroxy-2-oxoglutarate aldolase